MKSMFDLMRGPDTPAPPHRHLTLVPPQDEPVGTYPDRQPDQGDRIFWKGDIANPEREGTIAEVLPPGQHNFGNYMVVRWDDPRPGCSEYSVSAKVPIRALGQSGWGYAAPPSVKAIPAPLPRTQVTLDACPACSAAGSLRQKATGIHPPRVIAYCEHTSERYETRSIPLPEVARMIRATLKGSFPDTAFSVRSKRYSGGSSIDIHWTNGPRSQVVDRLIGRFEGATFDGMTDSKGYRNSEIDGLPVHFQVDFVHTSREATEEFLLQEHALGQHDPLAMHDGAPCQRSYHCPECKPLLP